MKKLTFLILFMLFCSTAIHAQKIIWSFDVNHRTELKDFGLGTQVMIPVYRNLMIAPKVAYFFEKEHKISNHVINSSFKHSSLNYGVDAHYAFYLKNTQSFVSPFLGVEGMTTWSKTSGTATLPSAGSSGYSSQKLDGDFNGFTVLGNIGLAAKWHVDSNIYLGTQVKYAVVFEEIDDSHFVFTVGVGFSF